MKKLLVAVVLSVLPFITFAEPKTKQVCTDVKDKAGKVVKNKDGSNKQTCKTIKIHKKYEGTQVQGTPPAKK